MTFTKKISTLIKSILFLNKKEKKDIPDSAPISYNLNFKICFPIRDGYIETKSINIDVPANSQKEAEEKLKSFVLNKTQIKILNNNDIKREKKIDTETEKAFAQFDKIFENFGDILSKKK